MRDIEVMVTEKNEGIPLNQYFQVTIIESRVKIIDKEDLANLLVGLGLKLEDVEPEEVKKPEPSAAESQNETSSASTLWLKQPRQKSLISPMNLSILMNSYHSFI